jgi:peroxiredoxin
MLALAAPVTAAAGSGEPAPACAFSLKDSGAADLRQFRGKVVYVDFWASWCTSCVQSFPFLSDLDRAYAARGLKIIGVNMDQRPADAARFLEQHPAGFDIAQSPNGACAKAFGVKAMPSSFVIDRRGLVRETHQGFRPGEARRLQGLIEQLLAEP